MLDIIASFANMAVLIVVPFFVIFAVHIVVCDVLVGLLRAWYSHLLSLFLVSLQKFTGSLGFSKLTAGIFPGLFTKSAPPLRRLASHDLPSLRHHVGVENVGPCVISCFAPAALMLNSPGK